MGFIAIGDIHGCARTLNALLVKLNPGDDDHLVFIGDYIDRGPDSRGVIDRLLELEKTVKCTFLRGNHEALFLDYLDEGAYDLWAVNGGVTTLNSYMKYGGELDIPDEHINFLRETKLFLDTEEFFFVHAGLRPDMTIQENLDSGTEEVYLWERGHLKAKRLFWEKTVVCGHTPQPEPLDKDLLINIDTGCVYYTHPNMGFMTAVRLPKRAYISVPYLG